MIIRPIKIIEELVRNRIEVTLKLDNDKLIADLNSLTKSHCYMNLSLSNECQLVFHLRYDRTLVIDKFVSIEDAIDQILSIILYDCTHGRDFINGAWIELAKIYHKVIPDEFK